MGALQKYPIDILHLGLFLLPCAFAALACGAFSRNTPLIYSIWFFCSGPKSEGPKSNTPGLATHHNLQRHSTLATRGGALLIMSVPKPDAGSMQLIMVYSLLAIGMTIENKV